MSPARLRTIDGLRGVAAFGVVLYHLNSAVLLAFDNWVHPYLQWVLEQGFLGVDVFFVLSGFVIPFSVRNADLTGAFLGRFALRRSIRLDPPYWAAIFLEIALIWLGLRIGLATAQLPDWPQLLSHFLYAQNILGHGDIVDIFWTLCFEIQFYLALISMLVMGQMIEKKLGHQRLRAVAIVVFSALFLISVLGRYEVLGVRIHPGFALVRWFQFFMGVCVFWLVSGKTSWHPLVGTWIVLAIVLALKQQSPVQLVPIATSGLLWWSYNRDQMATALSGRPWQFLGLISYSLYLFHASVGWRWIRLLGMYIGADASLAVVFAVFLSGCFVAIGVAWVAWKLLEVPSMRLSKTVTIPLRK